jgi:predicted enzyme related to lactoylglutathione lyase
MPCHDLRTQSDLNCAYAEDMDTRLEWKLELITVPVSDVDRAKAFYVDQIGFNADHDQRVNENLRFVQLTPKGSACSIAFGEGLTTAAAGTAPGLQMVVADIEVAHAELTARGAPVSAIDDQPWGRFVYFADPDGNRWSVQQLPPRTT